MLIVPIFAYFVLMIAANFQISAMNSVGGDSMPQSVRRLYHRVATDEVWSNYCIKGKNKEKRSLSKLCLYKIVYREYALSAYYF